MLYQVMAYSIEQISRDMGTLIHRIEYFCQGAEIERNLWTGPLEGIIEIAKNTMRKKKADFARVVEEGSCNEVWAHKPNL